VNPARESALAVAVRDAFQTVAAKRSRTQVNSLARAEALCLATTAVASGRLEPDQRMLDVLCALSWAVVTDLWVEVQA
jgi:hypothetical protein